LLAAQGKGKSRQEARLKEQCGTEYEQRTTRSILSARKVRRGFV
jgi:hypothetical protein